MHFRGSLGGFALLVALSISAAAAAECHVERLPAVRVVVKDLQPLVWAKINGVKARFIVDTGSYWSMLAPQTPAQYHLRENEAPTPLWLQGVNGSTEAGITTVGTFTFLNLPFRNAQFFVGGNSYASGAVGLLGGRILDLADVEYDFGHGLMRFIETRHCKGVPLAYWAHGEFVGTVKLQPISARSPYLIGHATVNGKRIRVLFDTGSSRSILTLSGAKRVGITPSSPGVKPLGLIGTGIGTKWLEVWLAPLATFEIGDEKIEHSHILIGNFHLPGLRFDMVLGTDFFVSHHILVAIHRDKLYFTYNGGPVFDVGKRYLIRRGGSAEVRAGPGTGPTRPSGPPGATANTAGTPAGKPAAAETVPPSAKKSQADKLMRRGMVYASEGQYAHALVYMNRACLLAPNNAEYRFRRGRVEWRDKQPGKALSDFDTAIKLRPDLYHARLWRAELLLAWSGAPHDSRIQAKADINIVSLLAPDASDLRLQLANLYARIGQYAAAVRAASQWIFYHHADVMLPIAWNTRCWIRAEGDMQLHKALRDCDRAHARQPKSAAFLDSRGLVYLRLHQWRRAIKSYDAALRIEPKQATSLFGLGLAELRQGKKASGRAKLAAAVKLDPGIFKQFAHMRNPLVSPKQAGHSGACAPCTGHSARVSPPAASAAPT